MIRSASLLGAALVALVNIAHAQQLWTVSGGSAKINFFSSHLNSDLIRLGAINPSVGSRLHPDLENQFAVAPRETTLALQSRASALQNYGTGVIQFKGGFDLFIDGRRYDFSDFQIYPGGEASDVGFKLRGRVASAQILPFELDVTMPTIGFDPLRRFFMIGGADLRISRDFAHEIGRSELSGKLIGHIHVESELRRVGGLEVDRPSGPPLTRSGTPDVAISAMSSLSSMGRTGTFPNGSNALAMSTTSCNEGTTLIVWEPPSPTIGTEMNWNHPVIVQNVYRISNGRFEQIGEAWLKHGWWATNAGSCAPFVCQSLPGNWPSGLPTGWRLRPGCIDTYGTGNNADRNYLGPKNEVNPFTGVWNPIGSFFSGFQPDAIRRTNASVRFNPLTGTSGPANWATLDNQMVVTDADLNTSGAIFVYEGYYIAPGDVNKYNQVAWRQASATWSTGQNRWNFASTTAMTRGVALDAWASHATGVTKVIAEPRTDGDVHVAVRTSVPSAGRTAFDYAVHCFDLDRQVRSFRVPLDGGLTINNISFRDTDKIATNDWTWSVGPEAITFTMRDGANANPLLYGRTFNFRFEVNSSPTSSSPTMELVKPGSFNTLSATIAGPEAPAPLSVSGTINLGEFVGGPEPMSVTLTPVGGGTPTVINNVMVNPTNGSFTFTTTRRGTFDVMVDGRIWLKRKLPGALNLVTGGPPATFSAAMVNGDVNGDGQISPADFSLVLAGFGSETGDPTYSANADTNGNGEIGPSDFSIVLAGFGQEDDE